MEKLICSKCNKIVEGFTEQHVEFLMMQHQLKHRHDNGSQWRKKETEK